MVAEEEPTEFVVVTTTVYAVAGAKPVKVADCRLAEAGVVAIPLRVKLTEEAPTGAQVSVNPEDVTLLLVSRG